MLRSVFLSSALLGVGVGLAQGSPLSLVLTQSLVRTVQQSGKTTEELVPSPRTVRPGDVLVQQLTASNSGPTRVPAVLTVPVPQGTRYVGQPTPAGTRWSLQFSHDGGKNFGEAPLKERVTVTEGGKTTTREVVVAANRYTHVRWTLASINPDESLKFNFRVAVK